MILADTSVWIDYFNGTSTPQTDRLDHCLMSTTVLMADLVLLEILQGFRKDQDYNAAKQALAALEQVEILNSSLALKAAENYRALRSKGITIRKTPDVIIATYCIEAGIPLLFSDRDFQPFVEHMGLQNAQFDS